MRLCSRPISATSMTSRTSLSSMASSLYLSLSLSRHRIPDHRPDSLGPQADSLRLVKPPFPFGFAVCLVCKSTPLWLSLVSSEPTILPLSLSRHRTIYQRQYSLGPQADSLRRLKPPLPFGFAVCLVCKSTPLWLSLRSSEPTIIGEAEEYMS